MRTDSNLCRKELTVHWSAPNSIIRSYLQPCKNSMWGDQSELMAPIIWLYQTLDAQKEEVFYPDLLITLRRHVIKQSWWRHTTFVHHSLEYVSNEYNDPYYINMLKIGEPVKSSFVLKSDREHSFHVCLMSAFYRRKYLPINLLNYNECHRQNGSVFICWHKLVAN